MPYCVEDPLQSEINSGNPSAVTTPRIAVNEIEDAI